MTSSALPPGARAAKTSLKCLATPCNAESCPQCTMQGLIRGLGDLMQYPKAALAVCCSASLWPYRLQHAGCFPAIVQVVRPEGLTRRQAWHPSCIAGVGYFDLHHSGGLLCTGASLLLAS